MDWINKIMKDEDKKRVVIIFLCTFAFGLLAHGFVMFNKFCFHDEARCITDIGQTINLGRWMLHVLKFVTEGILGSSLFSTPFFNASVSLTFIALVVWDIVKSLKIKDNRSIIMICGMMVVFPHITSLFGFMYAAPFYAFGYWLGIHGAVIACDRKKNILNLILGSFMACCAVGIYQAVIPMILSYLVLYFIRNEMEEENSNWSVFCKKAARSLIFMGLFMIGYFLINKLATVLGKVELSDYQGINDFGKTSILGYFERIGIAYREFFSPTGSWFGNMFPYSLYFIYPIMVIIIYVVYIFKCLSVLKKDRRRFLRLIALGIVYPIVCNFIYIMCDEETVHSLMMYGQIMVFVLGIYLISNMKQKPNTDVLTEDRSQKLENEKYHTNIGRELILKKIFSVGIMLFLFMYIRFANICGLKGELLQNRFINYCNVLISNIENTENYRSELPVLYIGEFNKEDQAYCLEKKYSNIGIFPYNYDSIINNYAWKDTMRIWCGFSPQIVEDHESLLTDQRIKDMPIYPNKGSIKVLDGILVVKFANSTENSDKNP